MFDPNTTDERTSTITRRAALSTVGLWLTLCAAVVVIPTALPQAAQAQEEVEITIRTIHATADGGAMDGKLEVLSQKLVKAFTAYSGFTELNNQTITIKGDSPFSFVLPDGTRFRLDYKGQDKGLYKLGVGVGKLFDTEMRASKGSTFFQAGLPFKNADKDGILIIAVTVK